MLKTLWDRLFRRARAPLELTEAQILDELRAVMQMEIAGGFTPREALVELAVSILAGDVEEAGLRREAERIFPELVAAHDASMSEWPEVTDCDRLDAAFAALEASGVISRQNFSCCGMCGSGEIWDEIEDARKGGRPVRGYAFFHQQDTEGATQGDGIYLNYGADEEGEDAAVAIGREVVAALEAKGLRTDWDGHIENRIRINLDWKRRPPPTMRISGTTS
ncbi:hypothetical protein [Brevundimonas sp.]|uniref:DUF6891 domain-containing protein n=1 Tax=Brevundimonas sp. TaxID=1871086 RepID=UPI00260CEC00|nr:hypothetical protein [Brevundimonas sp.]